MTVSRRLQILALATVVAMCLLGAVGYAAIGTDVHVQRFSEGLRANLEADMMHDAIRADALAAMLAAGDAEALRGIRTEFDEHAAHLAAQVTALDDLDLGPEVVSATAAIRPVLDGYVAAADGILRAAGTDLATATAALPGFDAAFTDLEGAMGAVSDLVADGGAQAQADATARNHSARRNVLLIAGLATVVVAGAIALTTRSVSRAVGGSATAFAEQSTTLGAISARLSQGAGDASSKADVVAAASQQVSYNVQTVAAAVEEMTASVREIAQSATEASRVAAAAVDQAQSTNATVAKLGRSSADIGDVLQVITSIAGQTNMLALNATIEAARAGEAGRGFAVVAGEVKDLAQETARATEQIRVQIAAIQDDTVSAVAAIEAIQGVIGQIADTQMTIASAVEEQTATTNEIGRNVTEAALGSVEISRTITDVADSVRRTSEDAATTERSAAVVSDLSASLRALVGGGETVGGGDTVGVAIGSAATRGRGPSRAARARAGVPEEGLGGSATATGPEPLVRSGV